MTDSRTEVALSAWKEDMSNPSKFNEAAFFLCIDNNVEGISELLEAAKDQKFNMWHVYNAGLRISEGMEWKPESAKLCPSYSPDKMPKYMRGLDTFRAIWTESRESEDINLESLKLSTQPAKHVCVVSCDSIFFQLYFKNFFESFMATAGENDVLNVHVVNPTEEVLTQIAEIDEPKMSCTIERVTGITPAYYACARFFAARKVLDLYPDASLIITDFDAVFQASMTEIFKNAPPRIAGRRVASPKIPWQIWMASFTLLPNDENSRSYLDRFSKLTLPLLRDKSLEHWYIDQNALAVVVRKYGFEIRNDWKNSSFLYKQTTRHSNLKLALR